jgi:hypothetical protein
MDTFDLRKYLGNNPLTESYQVFKISFPDGSVAYHARQDKNANSFLNHVDKVSRNNEKNNTSLSALNKKFLEFGKENADIEVVASFPTKEEAEAKKTELINAGPSLTKITGLTTKRDQDTTPIQVKKADTAPVGGELYLANSVLQQYLKQGVEVDMKSKINHPSKGEMYKITSNVERVD